VDLQTGQQLFAKNADELAYPASTTKILTALLIIERGDLDQLVEIVREDTRVQRTTVDLRIGSKISRRTLLYALLIHSANDAALALARDHSGSVIKFSEAMNSRAILCGARSSHFTNPHGLHDSQHYTTARDLSRIAFCAMRAPLFREIVANPEWVVDVGNGPVFLRNHNRLLREFPGTLGVKAGFTQAAQMALVSAARRNTTELLSVALRSTSQAIFDDSKTMFLFGFAKMGLDPL
jgi:D-alanyl-D-alanine carboxypeptidase